MTGAEEARGADPRPTREEIAERIAVSAAGLGRLASANRLPFLAALCEMAALEAWRAASEAEEPGGQAEGEEGGGRRPRVDGSGASRGRAGDALRVVHST